MWKKNNIIPSDNPLQKQIQSQLQQQQLQINRIQKQTDMIGKLQESFFKKQQQIERLNALVDKYRPYYENCSAMRLQLAQKESALRTYAKENQLLRREFEELIVESERMASQLKSIEIQKQAMMRQRHSIERVNRQIEQIFKEYQAQCRKRQQELLRQLQDHRKIISNLQTTIQEIKKIKQVQKSEGAHEDLSMLKQELNDRERQLQKQKILNHQLSIEFDKSVNKICQFQKELNNYRIENHELKKTLGLVLQQDKYQKLHQKYMNKKDSIPRLSDSQQQQQQQQQSLNHSSPSMSQIKF